MDRCQYGRAVRLSQRSGAARRPGARLDCRPQSLGLPRGAFVSAFHLDLADDPDERPTPRRFGARLGRNAFIDHLNALEDAGVDHLALLLRPSRRPLDEVIDELSRDVLPVLNRQSSPAKTAAE
ncbi:hypothetical protein AGR8A_Lc10588 [Agrobacterium fabrum str. J-07]|nr:hypothetical protein AGR8A_Lc10588 [Agrobacterium fabrum str. J-07]